MSALATLEDYEARYGATSEPARVEVLLNDASNYVKALYLEEWGFEYLEGDSDVFAQNAPAVVCAIVSRVVNTPAGLEGVSQASQTAGSYNASFTYANPTGDFYLTKTDKARLGFTNRATIGTIAPMLECDRLC